MRAKSKTRSEGLRRAHRQFKAKFAAARAKSAAKRRARLDPEILRMHADYCTPMSLAAVGRKYGRNRRSVHELFIKRGLTVRPPAMKIPPKYANGQIIPAKPITEKELAALIARETKLRVPVELKLEWRKWSWERRGKFITRLRARLNSPNDRPLTPFSDNVEPFDYASSKAQAICLEMNRNTDSRTARIKLDVCSQGVIYEGKLWFWCRSKRIGYQMGPWTPGEGRPCLHRVLWEKANGRKLRADEVVRFIDGNWNNLVPENLTIATRNDLARENQAAGLTRKSREVVDVLLRRSQKGKDQNAPDLVTALQQTA
jgi:hypothetical protein